MNKAKLKSYAPQARVDFIAAVTARANLLGLSEKSGQLEVAPAQTQGDVTVIAGQPWPAKVASQRDKLISRMKRDGFNQTCEAVAYTWFNRFAAIRYMELHDYLGHGHRALSSVSGGLPDILNYAADLATGGDSGLPGLKLDVVTEMKLAGNRDGDLYRMLLVAQCNALSRAMPFLFERIDDDSELLLPDNLLRSDSVIAKLVEEIPEEDWAEVEIIGWLYQFYISEKKDQVIGKVVKSEDIPAATQLFTPNWIVQYLVQNSVGRLWLMANPQSTLTTKWPYYITPAEQTPQVQEQLDNLIQARVKEDGDTLNPESITVLDPACGSGHILVVAYDVLKAIYLERGYQPRGIPRLILEKNLYGLDIDDRAAQMASFALLMKARADDRRLFNEQPKLNIFSIRESNGLVAEHLASQLSSFKINSSFLSDLLKSFVNAKTFGSLIKISPNVYTQLSSISSSLEMALQSNDLYERAAAEDLLPFVTQAKILSMRFDSVIENPPYMNIKGMTPTFKKFAESNYAESKTNLFSMFMSRVFEMTKKSGFAGFMTPISWMSLNSFEKVREEIYKNSSISSFVQPEYNAFWDSAHVAICSFILQASPMSELKGRYFNLAGFFGAELQPIKLLEAINGKNLSYQYLATSNDFVKIPGGPVAYWIKGLENFSGRKVGDLFISGGRNKTHDNVKFLRYVWETKSGDSRWIPYANGGDFRKFAGNDLELIDWSGPARDFYESNGGLANRKFWGREGITWSLITSAITGFRIKTSEQQYSSGSPTIFGEGEFCDFVLLGLLNSPVARYYLKAITPTVNTTVGDVFSLPYPIIEEAETLSANVKRCVEIARADWDFYEISQGFQYLHILSTNIKKNNLSDSYNAFIEYGLKIVNESKLLETACNKLYIAAHNLESEVSAELPLREITLNCNPYYRYATPIDDYESRFQRDTSYEIISYIIGCIMGRYSLDEPGLIYAQAGNEGFEPYRYPTFPADADGIVPITDELWFADDAPSRIREFLRAAWGPNTLEENMAWLAESLGSKASETPDETIRRYIADKFFKDHLQTYKKRPIYWLFSSGKQGAFQALVYLHRYSEGTLARLRAEYVVPLTSKIQSRIEMLQKDASSASSTAARNKLAKEVERLQKKHVELLAYDEQLRHYADMRITLDLDDGVKVNYGKFGNLLAEVKAVTGGASDD